MNAPVALICSSLSKRPDHGSKAGGYSTLGCWLLARRVKWMQRESTEDRGVPQGRGGEKAPAIEAPAVEVRHTGSGRHAVGCDMAIPKAKIWRYLDFTKFIALLETSALHFSRADKLGDEFEGSLPAGNKESILRYFDKDPGKWHGVTRDGWEAFWRKKTLEQRERTFVNCWYMSEHESAAMWTLYGRDERGVAVQSTSDRLAACVSPAVSFHAVNYIDFQKDRLPVPSDPFLSPFLVKRKSFEHERELRAIIQHAGHSGPGIAEPVDLAVLLERVHVAPKSPAWLADLVHKVVSRYGLRIPVEQSSLDATPVF